MRCREYLFPIGIVAAGVAAGLGAATAQEVLQRARPEYDPKGLPVGAFRLFPTLDVAFTSDDNVFRNTAPTVSDTYFAFSPRAELQSEWTNHELVIRGGANVLEYGDQSDESRTEWDVGGDLRLDVLRTTIVNFSASHDSLHEARGLPDTPGFAAEPTHTA